MFKKILGGIAIVAIAVATALSVNVKSGDKGLTELGKANAAALADKIPNCPTGCLDNGKGCWCGIYYMDWLPG